MGLWVFSFFSLVLRFLSFVYHLPHSSPQYIYWFAQSSYKVVLELLIHTLLKNKFINQMQYCAQLFLSLSLQNTLFQSYLVFFLPIYYSVVTFSICSWVGLLFAFHFGFSPYSGLFELCLYFWADMKHYHV